MTQDLKYETGMIINRASGEAIPDDEPVFIFRARDLYARGVLQFYKMCVLGDDHEQAVQLSIDRFNKFRQDHPDRMKMPTTDLSSLVPPTL
jgi:hypothetical protein